MPEERQTLPKISDKSRTFVSQSLQLAEHDDQYLPRSFDVAEMRRDVELAESLHPIMVALKQLSEFVDDTYVQVGSEAYTAGLVVYQSAKRNGQGAASDNLLNALGQRFARKSKETPPTFNCSHCLSELDSSDFEPEISEFKTQTAEPQTRTFEIKTKILKLRTRNTKF